MSNKKIKSFVLNGALVATMAVADDSGTLSRKDLTEKSVADILAIYNANAKSTGDAEKKSFKDRDSAVKATWDYLSGLFGDLIQDTAPAAPAVKEPKSAAVGAVTGEKPAKAKKEPKPKKERIAVARQPRGTDRSYKMVATENPFKAETIRHLLFTIIAKHTTTSAARTEDKRISTPFMEELASRQVIAFTDEPVAEAAAEPVAEATTEQAAAA